MYVHTLIVFVSGVGVFVPVGRGVETLIVMVQVDVASVCVQVLFSVGMGVAEVLVISEDVAGTVSDLLVDREVNGPVVEADG